jgi:serine phosphatase RsbU (regulator of sigma subunit)
VTFPNFLTGDRGRDQRNVELLLGAVTELYASGDLPTRVRRAVDRAVLVTGAERGLLLLADGAGEPLPHSGRDAKGQDLPRTATYSRTAVRDVWRTRAPKLMTGTDADQPFDFSRSAHALKLRSILAVPLLVRDEILGVLYVDSRFATKEFTEGDRAVFEALAGLVAVAIDQARLAGEEAERKRLAAELDLARDVQQSLLPRNLPVVAGYEFAMLSRPCVETSGDYLDVIPLGADRIALVMGDVAGHGLGAAMFMTATHAILRTLLPGRDGLAGAFAGANAYLCRTLAADQFMSLFVGVLDVPARTLLWASAGHNPPLLRRRDGSVEELGKTGPVFGFHEDHAYGLAAPVPFGPGDALLLDTDGLFEARGERDGEPWGEERLRDALCAHVAAGRSSREVLDGVMQDLLAYVGSRPFADDVTGLLVRGVAG